MSVKIRSTDDFIDTRDITERIKELENDLSSTPSDLAPRIILGEPNEAYLLKEELESLKAFADEIGEEIFSNQETLINDNYFEDYTRDFASDIGAIDKDTSWPCNCIDWDQAVRELQMDYTCVEWESVTFWVR